ncbi:MAG: 3-isopropylmalate dehydratase large subunit [Rickettsiales bacterium]|nr:MAG: 3-isopropylmalate dehydratase large subunit [Rickettsiales bacterium]
MTGKTLYDKIWDSHIVEMKEDGTYLLYIDRHLMHEVTSPQAFEDIELNKYGVRHPSKIIAVEDHCTHTKDIERPISDPIAKIQLEKVKENTEKYGIEFHPCGSLHGGVCHAVAPEMGFVLPGTTLICGDSHTATHGALGAIAFGTGTSEVEHVYVTQTIIQKKMQNMRITINGKLPKYSSAKDVILYIIGKIKTSGGTNCAIEFAGDVIRDMGMDGRMTISNMAIEGGARVGIIAPDEKTFAYLKDKPWSPKGEMWDKAVEYWNTLKSDDDAKFDKEFTFNGEDIMPQVTWGTSPEDVIGIDDVIPDTKPNALKYIDLKAGDKIEGTKIDMVFIGACTNGRLDDLRSASDILKGKKIAPNVKAIVVPGTNYIREQAEKEGIAQIFKDAGFEWRWAGCSMCLGMNEDRADNGERVASTSNRNFENRQGKGAKTHLMSPAMAATAAINGRISDVRKN